MKTTLEYYDIYPKVLSTEAGAVVTIRALGGHVAFEGAGKYRVTLVPMNEMGTNLREHGYQTEDAV